MALPTRWTWVWAGSESWWWTGKPGMLQSTGSQRIGHNWATELKYPEVELPDCMVVLQHFSFFTEASHTVFYSGCINLHPTNSVQGFYSSHPHLHIFMCLLVIYLTTLEKYLFKSSVHLKIRLLLFLLLLCRTSSYILDTNLSSDICFANIFSHSKRCIFNCWLHPLMHSLLLWFSPIYLFLLLLSVLLVSYLRNRCQIQCHKAFVLCFLLIVL